MTSFSECVSHRVTLLRNMNTIQKTGCDARGLITQYIGLTLLLTDGVRYRDHEDEFHITTFFRVRFAKGQAAQYIGITPLRYSNKCLRAKDTIMGNHLRRIYLNCPGEGLSTGCRVIALLMLKSRSSSIVFLYGGNIPFVVSLCFASQRIPTVCPNCAGSISTIGLAPFCFKSAGLALV